MAQCRSDVIAWVGSNIVPLEGSLRAWLRRMSVSEAEIDDVVHDAYVAIARLDSVAHIRNPKTYLFQTAKRNLLMRVRHDRIVPIERLTEVEALSLSDDAPDAERQLSARQELERVRRLVAALPERCRQIFELRRMEGVSQKEIARRMGLPEHTVEAQAARGLRLIMKAMAGANGGADTTGRQTREDESATWNG